MASTVAQFVHKMDRVEAAYRDVPKQIARKGALAMKASTLASVRRVVPDLNLSGVGKKGGPLGVRFTITGDTAIVKATGPWQLIERDTKSHIIPKLKGARSKKSTKQTRLYGPAFGGVKTKKLATPYGPRAFVWHPGTQGKHPWRLGVEAGKPAVRKVADYEAVAPIWAVF